MKKVPLNKLKIDLARYAEAAARGEVIEVTKYNRPYVRLVSAESDELKVGIHFGTGELQPALKKKIALKKILSVLEEDRGER